VRDHVCVDRLVVYHVIVWRGLVRLYATDKEPTTPRHTHQPQAKHERVFGRRNLLERRKAHVTTVNAPVNVAPWVNFMLQNCYSTTSSGTFTIFTKLENKLKHVLHFDRPLNLQSMHGIWRRVAYC